MDRRTVLSTFAGKSKPTRPVAEEAMRPIAGGLEPYSGPWNFEHAAHILRRATFGPAIEDIRYAHAVGLETVLYQLLQDSPLPAPPLNLDYANDPNVPIGQTWVDAPFVSSDPNVASYRSRILRTWTIDNILSSGISIREKMTLFWHNHFATNGIEDPNFLYHHITLLRRMGLGNFRDLVKAITIDPTMLRFLNGNQNTRTGVNENYARELLELFTIGKGPLAGPGDYTNYTESDVYALARALSGWRDFGYYSTSATNKARSAFTATLHDSGDKVLSHRFNKVVIRNQNDLEYKAVVDIIFEQPEVARYICRKLYRWFVYYQITPEVETDIIAPLAKLMIQSNYEIRPVIQTLLGSAHFFDAMNVGPMIKNPLDFSWGLLKQLYVPLPATTAAKHLLLSTLLRTVNLQQMEYFNPPEVAGWKAYYQEPAFYRIWINSTTLGARMSLSDRLIGDGILINNFRLRIMPLEVLTHCSEPEDPGALVQELAALFFPRPLTQEQISDLKNILVPGLPDYVWGTEYRQYIANPTNTTYRNTVETKLRKLFKAMLSMAEYYLS
jgi:uncharacterized protein (DUF1800 family)